MKYQELFNLMRDEYDLILTDPEMEEIIRTVKLPNTENLKALVYGKETNELAQNEFETLIVLYRK